MCLLPPATHRLRDPFLFSPAPRSQEIHDHDPGFSENDVIRLYYTTDHLGSIREMVDGGGAVRASYKYSPYGERTKASGDLDSDFGFTGHYTHAVTGIILAPFRGYDPKVGRWLSRDPIEEQGGINLYGYVGNGPIMRIDLFGFAPGASDFGLGNVMQARTDAAIQRAINVRSCYQCHCDPEVLALGLMPYDMTWWNHDLDWVHEVVGQAAFEGLMTLATMNPSGGATGVIAKNGTVVKSFTNHGIDRAIGDCAKRAGTKPKAILDALKNPKKIINGVDKKGRPFQVFTGKDARVVVNPDTGGVISVNPTSGAGAH